MKEIDVDKPMIDPSEVVAKLRMQIQRHNPAYSLHSMEHAEESGYCKAMKDAIRIINGEEIQEEKSMIGYKISG